MRKYGLFHPPVLSFFSKDLYIDVARNWTGTGIIYLLLILTISWGLICARMHFAVSQFLATDGQTMLAKVPTLTLTKGIVSVDVEQPYIVKDDKDNPIMIIDTTGQYTSLDGIPTATLLLTQTQLITREKPGQTKTIDLTQLPDFTVDQKTMQGWMDTFGKSVALVAFPFLLMFSVMYRLLQLLFYALIAGAIASSFKLKLDFSTQMRLAAMAITPALVLNTILWVVNFEIPFWWPICFFMTLGYLYFGIGAVAKVQPPEEQPTEVRPSDAGISEPTALAPAPRL